MRLLLATLVIFIGLFTDGIVQSVNAQCKPSDGKIYIDPRLVQPRPMYRGMTPEISAMLVNPSVPESYKKAFIDNLTQQQRLANEPIVVPYTAGRILIHPQNPCIQQFIPN